MRQLQNMWALELQVNDETLTLFGAAPSESLQEPSPAQLAIFWWLRPFGRVAATPTHRVLHVLLELPIPALKLRAAS